MVADDFLLMVAATAAIVIVGVLLIGSALARQGIGEHTRDLWQTFFGGDDDLPSLPPDSLKDTPHPPDEHPDA